MPGQYMGLARSLTAAGALALALAWLPAATVAQDASDSPIASFAVDAAPPPGCAPETEPNDRPEEATLLPDDFCVSGHLVESAHQELYFWEVAPEDGMTTWAFTVRGVPATITSAHLLMTSSPLGMVPLGDVSEVALASTDAHLGTPPVTTLLRLPPGPYLVGISRGVEGYGQQLTDDRDYWIQVVRAGSVPPARDVEPNDDASVATPVSGAFALSGELEDGLDVFRWSPGAAEAASLWSLRASTSKGSPLTLEIGTTDAPVVLSAAGDADGVATLHDVALEPSLRTPPRRRTWPARRRTITRSTSSCRSGSLSCPERSSSGSDRKTPSAT